MPEQLEVGWYLARYFSGDSLFARRFTGTGWTDKSTGGDAWDADVWTPVSRLLERSEVEGKLAEAHRKLDWLIDFVSAPVTRESLKEIKTALDALCPASVEIKAGRWYACETKNWFVYPFRPLDEGGAALAIRYAIDGTAQTSIVMLEGDGQQLDCKGASAKRIATGDEVAELRKVVVFGT